MMFYRYAAGTDIGIRETNQDSYVCSPANDLWLVADGVGGLATGEIASAITSYTLVQNIAAGEGVNQSIEAAHNAIKTYADNEGSGTNMGAALVLLLVKGNLYNVFWAGDCRAYLFDGTLKQLTRDHTHSQYLIDSGKMTPEQAAEDITKDGITKALGVREFDCVDADRISDKWRPGQKILLCSDGLSGYVSDNDIRQIMNTAPDDDACIEQMIQRALDQGSKDNVTAVLVSAPDELLQDEDDTEIPDRAVLNGLRS